MPCCAKGLARGTRQPSRNKFLADDRQQPIKDGTLIQVAFDCINCCINRQDANLDVVQDTHATSTQKVTITTASSSAEKMQHPDHLMTINYMHRHSIKGGEKLNLSNNLGEAYLLVSHGVQKRFKLLEVQRKLRRSRRIRSLKGHVHAMLPCEKATNR